MVQLNTKRISHADGTFSDIYALHTKANNLQFEDIDQADQREKSADFADYRYNSALKRGCDQPAIVIYQLHEADSLASDIFPNCHYLTEEGEYILSANSFINATMRCLFSQRWICYCDGDWQLIFEQMDAQFRPNAEAVLAYLVDKQRLMIRTERYGMIDFSADYFDVIKDLIGIGRCSFISEYAAQNRSAFIFNTCYFLLEVEDVISHHSARNEAYSFWMKGGEIMRPPIYRRGAIWQYEDGSWEIGFLGMQDVAIELANQWRLVEDLQDSAESTYTFSINEPENGKLILFTRYFGVKSDGFVFGRTPADPQRIELTIIDRKIVGWKKGGDLLIPQNGYILSFELAADDEVALIEAIEKDNGVRYSLIGRNKPIKQAIQTGPILLHNGQSPLTNSYLESDEQFWPSREIDGQWVVGVVSTSFETDIDSTMAGRGAIGIDANGDLVIVQIPSVKSGYGKNGRDSFGATLNLLVESLREAGAVSAINIDGGGSTQAYFCGEQLFPPGDRRGKSDQPYQRLIPSVGVVRVD